MTDRDSDEKFDKGQLKQTIGGQQSHESEYGEQGDQATDASDEEIMRKEAFGGSGAQPGVGSAPPRSVGTRGSEFGQFGDHDDHGQQGQSGTGQADLGSQAGSTLSSDADQQELGKAGGEVDQPGSYARGEGFILKKSPDEEQDEASSEGGVG